MLGAISDVQESLQQAIADLWTTIPHQLCQFHVLREASRPIYEQDRKLKEEMRKTVQQRVLTVRKQLEQQRHMTMFRLRHDELLAWPLSLLR